MMAKRNGVREPAAKTVVRMDSGYTQWVSELKRRYRTAQIKAAISVNSALLEFYWHLGREISNQYPGRKRGIRFFETLSADLQIGIENPKGLSPRNLKYALAFYEFYGKRQQLAADNAKTAPGRRNRLPDGGRGKAAPSVLPGDGTAPALLEELVSIPWGHHILLLSKCGKDFRKALFYIRKTIGGGWSRNQLATQLEAGLYERTGRAADNFDATLPAPESRLVRELVKNEYSFGLTETVDEENEREIEKALVRNITRTLTELGGGFAYVGHQVRVPVGGKDFWPDLVFYHLALRRYLVIELKVGEFQPEHVGQLGFYMTAIDRQIRHEWDGKTIGLILCQRQNGTVVEYALADNSHPMGVAQYTLSPAPPEDLAPIVPVVSRLGAVVDSTIAEVASRADRQGGAP